MKTFKTFSPFTKRPPGGKPSARRGDPMRWIVAGLVLLALIGIGAMEIHVLMFRGGKDFLHALLEAGAFVLAAALPAGYLVYRFWFAERIFMKPLKGFRPGEVDHDDLFDDDWFHSAHDDTGFRAGPYGFGLYSGGIRIDGLDD